MAVRFDAQTDAYSATTGLPASTTWSVTCWAYITTDRNTASAAFGILNTGVTAGIFLETDTDGTTWRVFDMSTSVGGFAASVGQWTRMAVVVSGTSVTFYAGAPGSALTSASGTLNSATPASLTVGDDGSGASFLNGRLANFKMWDAALSSGEVTAELGQIPPALTTNLLRYHPFYVAETADHSGHGRTLTAGSTGTSTEAHPPSTRAAVDLTHVGSTTWVAPASSAAVAPTYPSGLANATATQTDTVYAFLHIKPDTATVATPANWTLVGSETGGSGSVGAGTGATRVHVYKRTATAALSGTTQSFTITGGSSPVAFMRAYRATGNSVAFEETLTFWSVATASTTIGGTAGASLSLAAKDEINCVIGTPDDQSTTLTLTGLTATGATLGTLTRDPNATVTNSQGNDISATAYRIAVTAGTSTAAPVATATSSSSETAMGLLMRVRATSDIYNLADLSDDFNDNSTDLAVRWPAAYGSYSETGGVLVAGTTTTWAGYMSASQYALAGSSVFAKVVAPSAGDSSSAFAAITLYGDTTGNLYIQLAADSAQGLTRWAYVNTTLVWNGNTTYDATNHAWLRLIESAGSLLFQASPNGVTWSTLDTQTTPATYASNNLIALAIETARGSGTGGSATFDNLNVIPASTQAPAGHAAGTGAAHNPTAAVGAPAGHAAA
jgi:hypothetical protein